MQRLETHLLSNLHPTPKITYVDAPHELELKQGDSVKTRAWFDRGGTCACKSLEFLEGIWKRVGPFDGLIGFSAGAAIATILASLPSRFPGIAWVIAASSPTLTPCENLQLAEKAPHWIRSLHAAGSADRLVEAEESFRNADNVFEGWERHHHDQGHAMPMRAEDIGVYFSFIRQASRPSNMDKEAVLEELESLSAIYGDDFSVLLQQEEDTADSVVVGFIKISSEDTRWSNRTLYLTFRLGPTYPQSPPHLRLHHEMGLLEFSSAYASSLISSVSQAITPLFGSPMLFEATCTAQQALQDLDKAGLNASDTEPDSDGQEDEEQHLDPLIVVSGSTVSKSKSSRGPWRHTIGLVGKPSAGKSTFFNCATRSRQAKVAPHPFTTIDPNVGVGYWQVPEGLIPSAWKPTRQRVFLPCLVKDVAGLVPGACEGRGRGNQFLNDLCDADVLIHVVDASGMSDEDGNIVAGIDDASSLDPMNDIRWVKEELRQWILGNITKKWSSVIRRPSKLIDMFSGYQAPRWLIDQAIRNGGLDPEVDRTYARTHWTLAHAARVVDSFLEVRFPILLALNKADLPTSARHIQRILGTNDAGSSVMKESGSAAAVPVCAAAEAWLQEEDRDGRIRYDCGDDYAELAPGLDASSLGLQWESEWQRAQNVLLSHGGTGVLTALTAAVMLRPPVICHPVEDLESVTPIPPPFLRSDGAPHALTCFNVSQDGAYVAVKPGTTVLDVFKALTHDGVFAGQYVRSEGMKRDGTMRRPLKKETEIEEASAVVRLMGNRRSRWQVDRVMA
ncbi:hypothetical protein HDU67_006584 [Dinochytrium kinnereticum]|nr:hypothetical protein HDU67_006584 [Dinochytrium kinnereticum]